MKRRPMGLPKKNKLKRKKKKNNRKRKRKRRKLQCFALKPEHGPRGIWRKSLKPDALSQLVGSHRLSCSLHGWMGETKQVVGARVLKSFEVQSET